MSLFTRFLKHFDDYKRSIDDAQAGEALYALSDLLAASLCVDNLPLPQQKALTIAQIKTITQHLRSLLESDENTRGHVDMALFAVWRALHVNCLDDPDLISEEQALKYIEHAHNKKNKFATFELAQLSSQKWEFAEALAILNSLEKENFGPALFALATEYQYGNMGVKIDLNQAQTLYTRALAARLPFHPTTSYEICATLELARIANELMRGIYSTATPVGDTSAIGNSVAAPLPVPAV
jgi:hypothetical protein